MNKVERVLVRLLKKQGFHKGSWQHTTLGALSRDEERPLTEAQRQVVCVIAEQAISKSRGAERSKARRHRNGRRVQRQLESMRPTR